MEKRGYNYFCKRHSLNGGNWLVRKKGEYSHWFSHQKKWYLWDTRVPALDLRAVTVIVSISVSVSSSFPVLQISYPWKAQTLEANFPPQQRTEEKRKSWRQQLGKQRKPNCNDVSLHDQNIWQWIDTTLTHLLTYLPDTSYVVNRLWRTFQLDKRQFLTFIQIEFNSHMLFAIFCDCHLKSDCLWHLWV